jgi:hypothetical protein
VIPFEPKVALSGALVTMAGLLAVELVLNIAGVRVVALLNQMSPGGTSSSSSSSPGR